MTAPSPVVVKIGGSTLGAHDTSLDDLAVLHEEGLPLIVVHGGGDTISEWLAIHGVESRFVRGLRATDEPALEVVVAVLAGLVNKDLVARLNALGARALGIAGADAAILRARRYDPELGFVGEVASVDVEALQSLLTTGLLPILAPIGLEIEGDQPRPQLLNINADTAAGEVARAVAASHLIFLTDVPGILDAEGHTLTHVGTEEVGMIPKLDAALRAAEVGVRALVINGRLEHALRAALAGEAVGTAIET
jgi:acetylglutamate kinase